MKLLIRLLVVAALLIPALAVSFGTAQAQGNVIVYRVQFGDTVSGIAVRYNTTTQAIVALNGLTNPSRIFVGQHLFVPVGSGTYYPPAGRSVHIVQPGENLFRIGLRYGWDWYTLAALNGISDPNRVYVGQRLVIPAARYHTVRPGETVASIARAYGSTVAAITAANGLWDPNLIYPGQRLLVP
ncbi:MAG: LysM peptidoglycan-binding domain-containing protein [Anaerolineae bacterium]|nr:LysM peptidoglycan-binding domain-containing protein [Anaerolineae bacterium]